MCHIEPDGRFNDLKEVIHVDEKWFFVAEINKNSVICCLMKTPSTEPVSIKATTIKLCLVLLLQGQVGMKASGSNNYKCTALHPQAAAPAQVQAAAASPQAQAAA
jgi:hypothetical protein